MKHFHFSLGRLFIGANLLIAPLLGGTVPNARAQTSTLVGNLNKGLASQTATMLGNGKLLVVGGTQSLGGGTESSAGIASVELYAQRK